MIWFMPRFTMRQMMALVFAVCVVITSLIFPSGRVAGIVLLMTLLTLVVAALGVIYRRGNDRAWWLGLTLFGWGYMALASGIWWDWYMVPPGGFRSWKPPNRPNLPTSAILDQLHPIFLRDRGPGPFPVTIERLFAAPQDRAIHGKLALPLALNLPHPAHPSLEDLARSIAEATKDRAAGLPEGIPIDFDPQGLQDADRTPNTTVDFVKMEGVPLGQTLSLMLDQVTLIYYVRGGRLTMTCNSIGNEEIGAFLRVGHCYFAIAVGWFGATVCRWSFKGRGSRSMPKAPQNRNL
jgi:hypothetical protein